MSRISIQKIYRGMEKRDRMVIRVKYCREKWLQKILIIKHDILGKSGNCRGRIV